MHVSLDTVNKSNVEIPNHEVLYDFLYVAITKSFASNVYDCDFVNRLLERLAAFCRYPCTY